MASTRILVVEDEDNIAYVVESALRVNGFEVVRARTGHAALAAVHLHEDKVVDRVHDRLEDPYSPVRRARNPRDRDREVNGALRPGG